MFCSAALAVISNRNGFGCNGIVLLLRMAVMMVGSESDWCGVFPVVGVPGIVYNLGWNDVLYSPVRYFSGNVLDMSCSEGDFICGSDRQCGFLLWF